MTVLPYVLAVASALLTLGVVVELLRRRRLRERHAFWWLVAGILALLAGLIPSILVWFSDLVGVVEPLNLVFFSANAILFLVCIQHSAELTTLEAKVRTLAEHVAVLELRVHELGETSRESAETVSPGERPSDTDEQGVAR